MKYITLYTKQKGWTIAKQLENNDETLVLPLTENDCAEIVIKLNAILCQV